MMGNKAPETLESPATLSYPVPDVSVRYMDSFTQALAAQVLWPQALFLRIFYSLVQWGINPFNKESDSSLPSRGLLGSVPSSSSVLL